MFIEYVLFFYMLGVVLVAYIFHKIDERSKDVPTSKVERKENQREVGKSDASSFKKSENKIELKKEKGNPSLFQLNSSGNALIH